MNSTSCNKLQYQYSSMQHTKKGRYPTGQKEQNDKDQSVIPASGAFPAEREGTGFSGSL